MTRTQIIFFFQSKRNKIQSRLISLFSFASNWFVFFFVCMDLLPWCIFYLKSAIKILIFFSASNSNHFAGEIKKKKIRKFHFKWKSKCAIVQRAIFFCGNTAWKIKIENEKRKKTCACVSVLCSECSVNRYKIGMRVRVGILSTNVYIDDSKKYKWIEWLVYCLWLCYCYEFYFLNFLNNNLHRYRAV